MSLPPRVRRSVTVLGAAAGLVGAFAAGTAFTGSDPGPDRAAPPPRGGTDASPVAFTGSDLTPAESCDDLLDWYVARGVDRVGPWGWDVGYGGDVVAFSGGVVEDSASSPADSVAGRASELAKAPSPVASTSRVTNGESGTNVQELGVDEPDVVKTDGRTLFRVERGDLTTYDVTGDEVVRLGSADLVDLRDGEILLSGDTVVAIGHSNSHANGRGHVDDGFDPGSWDQTRVIVLDVSDPSAPQVEHTYLYSSSTLEARLHGDTVRLVTQAGLPDLDFEQAGRRDERETTRENRQLVRETTIDDWLPTVSTDGGEPERLVECEDVAIPTDGDTLGTIAVVGFEADDPGSRSVSGLAVDTDLAYLSTDQLYLATSPWGTGGCWDVCMADGFGTPRWFPGGDDDGVSHLYAFDLDGRATTYAASGEVDGTIRDRWAMDEADGVLRVAVGPTSRTGNFNSVVTFRQDGNDLVEAGRVDKLGVNESIQSMRWFDGLAIMVTFRQVDPLYAIDLTDPDEPRLMGKLKIPGFSAYLHPLGSHRLLGLGEGPAAGGGGWGAQAGLFNVTDLTDPQQLDVVSYGPDTYALATQDPRQLTWLPDERKVLTVVSDYRRGGQVGLVSVLTLANGTLENRSVEVEYGDDVSAVRLVPLPDGRVVLVTGGEAEFFEV